MIKRLMSHLDQLTELNLVHKYYPMDPKTEDLISNGIDLKNGMVVLIAGPDVRVETSKSLSEPWVMDRALENNRWALISEIEFAGSTVSFVATYEDGTKRKRSSSVFYAWLVKLDSLPSEKVEGVPIESESEKELRTRIYLLVKRAMHDQDVATYRRETSGMNMVADQTTDEIMKLVLK